MTMYAKGRRFEWAVRDALEEDGYEVLRSAGSKTKIDLVGIKTGQVLFVQCKLNGLCPPAERARLRELAGMAGALPIVAYSHKDGRAAAVVRYRLLTGDGPKAFASWIPDSVAWEKLEPLTEYDRGQHPMDAEAEPNEALRRGHARLRELASQRDAGSVGFNSAI